MAQGQYFDATQFTPEMGGGGPQHPIGQGFPARITDTSIEENNNKNGSYLAVEFSTAQGKAVSRLNLWHENTQTVEIAQKQLAAICYATGVHRLDMQNKGKELIGRDCQIDVRQQIKNPAYTEVSAVRSKEGYDPKDLAGGNRGAAQPQPQPQPATTSGFGTPATTAPAPQPFQQPQAQPQPFTAPQPQAQPQPFQQPQPTPAAQPEQPWTPGGGGQPAPWAR